MVAWGYSANWIFAVFLTKPHILHFNISNSLTNPDFFFVEYHYRLLHSGIKTFQKNMKYLFLDKVCRNKNVTYICTLF